MKLRNKYYTYPVLAEGLDFYVDSAFNSDVDMKNKVFSLEFSFMSTIKNDLLSEMLLNKKIVLVYHVECPKTSYRKAFVTNDLSYNAAISIGDIDERIEVNSFMVANENINAYKNDDFSSDYRGFTFDIPRGCVMGIGQGYVFHVTKTRDELKDATSIFSIIPISDKSINVMQYYLDKQKIVIRLPQEMHRLYVNMSSNNDLQSVMHSMIIVPGLIYVLQLLQQDNNAVNDYEDYRWFRALRKACKLQNVDLNNFEDKDVVELAQNLLDNPLNKAFNYLQDDLLGVFDDEA